LHSTKVFRQHKQQRNHHEENREPDFDLGIVFVTIE
jgi:hypothetical protein